MSLFRVFVDGQLFYHPHLSQLSITEAKVQEDAENIDSLTLSAPFNHPYDYDQQGIFFVYPYADLFLWKHQRDDYYQNDSHFGQVDAAAFSGQPDPECDQRYLHNHLHDL